MAYESWAGGKISSEETPSSRSPRGGYIPLSEIPNAPKTVEMPLARYQDIPSIRHEYVSTELNMKGRAADLMQKDLPSSFEEAGNIRTAAAGKGQMAWGKAIGAGGKEVGTALGTFSNALARLSHEAIKSKDETDLSRYDQAEDNFKIRVKSMTETTPPTEWGKELEKIKKEFTGLVGNYGTSTITKNRLAARTASNVGTPEMPGWADTHLQSQTAALSLKQDLDFHQNNIEQNRKNGNYADNVRSYDYMEKNGYWKPEVRKQEEEKDALLESQGNFKIAEVNNPRAAKDEAKRVMDGRTSKDFPHLNKANAANHFVEAQNATRVKDQETVTDLSNAFAMGRTTDPAEIERLGRARGLPDEDILKLKTSMEDYRKKAEKDASANVKSDPAAIVGARTAVMNYDGNGDADGSKFKSAVNLINATIEPEMRDHFLSKLKAKTPESNQKKVPEALAREREVDSIGKEIHALGEKGLQFSDDKERALFQKAQKKLKDGKELDGKGELEVWRKGNQWIDDKLNEVDAAVAKEPDFAPGDLRTKIRKDMAPDIQKNIGTTNPAAPPPRASLNPAATAPTRDQIAAAAGAAPSQWVATAPRDIKRESAQFQKAMVGSGETYDNVTFTAYTPGQGNIEMEGPNKVSARGGPAYTVEGYQRGTFPYVSAAVDPKSDLAGKYFISPSHPNIVLKGEDTGSAFVGAGESHIDVAFENPDKAKNYKITGQVRVISEEDALSVSGAMKRGGGGISGIGQGTSQSPVVATVEQTYKGGSGAPMTKGTMNVGGVPYQYRSGGGGRGNLPPGEYVVTEHMPHRNTPGMVVGDVGFSFALSDKYDPRVGGTRTLLRIHPDGGAAGTAGCIGIVGGKEVQAKFRDDLSLAIRKAGGKLHLRVG